MLGGVDSTAKMFTGGLDKETLENSTAAEIEGGIEAVSARLLAGPRNARPTPEVAKVVSTFVEEINNCERVATMVGANSALSDYRPTGEER